MSSDPNSNLGAISNDSTEGDINFAAPPSDQASNSDIKASSNPATLTPADATNEVASAESKVVHHEVYKIQVVQALNIPRNGPKKALILRNGQNPLVAWYEWTQSQVDSYLMSMKPQLVALSGTLGTCYISLLFISAYARSTFENTPFIFIWLVGDEFAAIRIPYATQELADNDFIRLCSRFCDTGVTFETFLESLSS